MLEVLNKKESLYFEKEDIELMKIIADQAALAIENAYLYRDKLKKDRLSAIGEAMLFLSHDIKNILNGLLGTISLVDYSMKNETMDSVDNGWQMVKKNVDRFPDLIMDMLDFSSKKKPFYQRVNIEDLVQNPGKVYEEKFKEKGGSIRYKCEEKIGEVSIDCQGIERVLLNLISNRYEAIPEKRQVDTFDKDAS